MIPFPGESAPLDWARVTAGAPFADDGDAIRFRAGSATLVTGDAFVAGFYDHRYLEAGADAVFSVVVETLAGSSGTLSLTGGPDAAFTLLDGPASAYDLGDHVVTGAQTLVVPLPWVTVADYLTEAAETAVRVECTAGSVVVQQVKLRIWPPAGVGGGWSATPFVQAPQDANPQILTETGGLAGSGAIYTSQAAFRAALAAEVTSSAGVSPPKVMSSQMEAYDDPSLGLQVGGGVGIAYVARPGGNLTGPGFEEDSWIVPPTEVRGDDDRVIFQPTGDDVTTWLQPTATVAANSLPGIPPVAGAFNVDAVAVDTRLPVGTAFVSAVVSGTIGSVDPALPYTDVMLPEFATTYLRLSLWHPGHFADVAETGGTFVEMKHGRTVDGATFDRLTYRWTPAPYRYWSPTVVPRSPHLIFWRHDNLGAGANLVFQPNTRQSTGLVFGNN